MESIVDLLDHWAGVQPDARFSSFLDIEGQEKESYNYLELHERTRHLAEYLATEAGLRRGDRALLVYPPGLECVAAFFACARIGVLPVPACPPSKASPGAGLAKLAFIARDCGATAALTTDDFRRAFSAPGDGTPAATPAQLRWIATEQVRGRASAGFGNTPGATLFLQYTSGSTSDPKGVVVSHENVVHNARSTVDHAPVGVSWLPQYHDMGLIGYYLFPAVVGGTTYGISPMDFLRRPLLWLQTMSRFRATYSSSPNFGYEYCLREDRVPDDRIGGLDLSSLRVLMNASEPVRADTYRRFLKRFVACGLRREAHVVAYGLAENTLAATHHGRQTVAVDGRLLRRGIVRIEEEEAGNDGQVQLASCGTPLHGVRVRIVEPESRTVLGENRVGEIWICGRSTCAGYWRRPELTRAVFGNTLADDPEAPGPYLRTGDLGFLHGAELFVCGRLKDLIIVRGVNYYPQDIEAVVEAFSPKIRAGGVAALGGDGEEEALDVVVEVRSAAELPDPVSLAQAVQAQCGIAPRTVVFARAGTIARTTSGKIARGETRQRWRAAGPAVISTHLTGCGTDAAGAAQDALARVRGLLDAHRLAGQEAYTLSAIGLDSLALVELSLKIEQLFAEHGGAGVAGVMDVQLLLRLTVGEICSLLDQLAAAELSLPELRSVLMREKRKHDGREQERMRADAVLEPMGCLQAPAGPVPVAGVLLTGPTGFFGPFLLSALLRQTPYTYYALTRATDAAHGMRRIRDSLHRARVWTRELDEELEKRVRVVCGDLSLHRLGLDADQWSSLAARVQAICHNGALVNYVLNYDALRPHHVDGTRELLRFAFTGPPKEFHFISSTIVFGWTASDTVGEADANEGMENLDFGYAQAKWVAEQLVSAAAGQGLGVTIYRPSFITASTGGVASGDDIVIRLLAFMIRHGIAVNARNQTSFVPADIAAHNIAAIFARRNAAGGTLHVTADEVYGLVDVTRLITRHYGYPFTYYDIPDFVAEMKRRCTKEDPAYPLVDFCIQSQHKVARMQHKRYNSDRYREARRLSPGGRADPPLADTVSYLMDYLLREELIPRRNDGPQPHAKHAAASGLAAGR
jgi:thioester reductase-like protein